jgi:dethiobiotin synthetase
MSALFVAGTGTDIGKTWVTAGLIRHLRAIGIDARALKPIISGYDPANAETSDAGVLLAAMGEPINQSTIDASSPWRFAAPLSPDMAARREGRNVQVECVATFCRGAIAKAAGPLLVEGAGGLMTPMTDEATCLDLARKLDCPVLLIAGSYLGAISHALTAVEAVRHHDVSFAAIVVNETPGSAVDLGETVETLRRFLPHATIIAVARQAFGSNVFDDIAAACGLKA